MTLSIRNEKLMPTRSAHARDSRIGRNDLLTLTPAPGPDGEGGGGGGARVVASGRLSSWFDQDMSEVRHEPWRIQVTEGIPGRGERIFRFIVEGAEGSRLALRYEALKARTVEATIELRQTPKRP